MLEWYKNLYISEGLKGKEKKIIRKINAKKLTMDIYLLTFAANGVDELDIISANLLLQKTYRNRCPQIIGIAKGHEEAIDLVVQIMEETIKESKDTKIKAYLQRK